MNIKAGQTSVIDRILTIELARVTERAAVAAARLRGHGDEKAADQAAVDAMRTELNNLPIDGRVVIGEGERDEAPMLYIGEEVGTKNGPAVDIALDPLEGTTICAKNLPNSLAVIALAERGQHALRARRLHGQDRHRARLSRGHHRPRRCRRPKTLPASPRPRACRVTELTACILDRPRHARLIEDVRATGAAIRLIGDGDVAGVIHTTDPQTTGIDIYIGIGGAPEGVLAAAALRCTGGQMQGRLMLDTPEKIARARRMGIEDPDRVYDMEEMASGDVLFAATGVTDGNMLPGVRFGRDTITTHTIVMRSSTGTVREIKAIHRDMDKFA